MSSNDHSTLLGFEQIKQYMMGVQDHICDFLISETDQKFHEDLWDYNKGSGGGRTRVWEGPTDPNNRIMCIQPLEKAGVNYSGISGSQMPQSATNVLKLEGEKGTLFNATGVSLVLHSSNPFVPTIHMNIRYFESGSVWWFGGGIDLTPVYPEFNQIIDFHRHLQSVCLRHGHDYDRYKIQCDDYFFLKHRGEERGVGGIFFDHLDEKSQESVPHGETKSKQQLLDFLLDLGRSFNDMYGPFLRSAQRQSQFTIEQREFQLWRRSRYVEYNLLWDRGTKFGIQSEGRTDSILMSLPSLVIWKYGWHPPAHSLEDRINRFFLQPRDWVRLSVDAFDSFE